MKATNRVVRILLAASLISCFANFFQDVLAQKRKIKMIRTENFEGSKQDGKIVEGRRTRVTENVLDEKGNAIEYRQYKLDGSLSFKTVRVYNNKGEQVEGADYFNGELITKHKFIYRYLASGKVVEDEMTNPLGEPDGRTVTVYDANGRVTESTRYGPNGEVGSKSSATYDSNGRMLSNEQWLNGKLVSKFVAPSNGNAGENVMYHPGTGEATTNKGSQCNIEEKDAEGNWTKQVCVRKLIRAGKEEESIDITKRTITYF